MKRQLGLSLVSIGTPAFLNLDKSYPDQAFTIVIWGEHRRQFGAPELTYLHKRVCVSCTVESYRGRPQIEARRSSRIVVELP